MEISPKLIEIRLMYGNIVEYCKARFPKAYMKYSQENLPFIRKMVSSTPNGGYVYTTSCTICGQVFASLYTGDKSKVLSLGERQSQYEKAIPVLLEEHLYSHIEQVEKS